LQAGRRAHIARNGGRVSVDSATVCPVSPEEIDRTLDWLSTRLIFSGTRLADAVAIFNRYAADRGGLKLVLDQPALGEKRLGGSFRVDNVEGFVRLLERSSNIQSARRGAAELVLTAASRPER
jgi:transmembrane sensor